jgi:hypothetical protein
MSREVADRLLFDDLERWRLWQNRTIPAHRRVKGALTSATARPGPSHTVLVWGDADSPVVLVALDSMSPSQVPALIDPAIVLRASGHPVAVVLNSDLIDAAVQALGAPADQVISPSQTHAAPITISAVLSAGDHLDIGELSRRWAQTSSAPYIVVQHGILTPFNPPLPPGAHLLAWSEADARYWCNGNDHPRVSVGSQLLWRAATTTRHAPSSLGASSNVTFLGQLHGAELPRRATRKSVAALHRSQPVCYRPHPAESDIASRLQHRLWRREGIEIDAGTTLTESSGPVLSHFSTGLLEAASLGVHAYSYCVTPPRWLRDLWTRYELSPWGDTTPTCVEMPQSEPAIAIADYVKGVSV